jgi:DNA-damage-inducible protein D
VKRRISGPANGFERIRRVERGNEFWLARELSNVLEYTQYRNFESVIDRAIEACNNSKLAGSDHFAHVRKMVTLGSGATRAVEDWKLSRYACYLIVQNGDPAKPVIAQGQSYFAVQARRQELSDETRFERLGEDERRLLLRNELNRHNKTLSAASVCERRYMTWAERCPRPYPFQKRASLKSSVRRRSG